MADLDEPGSRALIAAETYQAEVSVPGWSISFGALYVDGESDTFVPTTFVRDRDKKTVHPDPGVRVWGPSREGEMDPETSGTIAAAGAAQRIETGQHKHHHCRHHR
jgi:hypothetical protein